MGWLIFIAGVAIGTIFHVVITKWVGKAKDTASEISKDVSTEANKVLHKKP